MLVVLRLNKVTGTSATYTLGREINFNKLYLRGVGFDFPSKTEPDAGGNAPTTGGRAVYLDMSILNDNHVLFFQGRNTTITGIDNLIPLGIVEDAGVPYRKMDLKLICNPTTYEDTQTITLTLKQIEAGVVTNLTNAQAFGSDQDSQPVDIDHGVNIYLEFEGLSSNNYATSNFTIANAT